MEWSRRVRVALVLAVPSCFVGLASSGTVTEEQAIRLFLEDSPQARRVAAVVRSVDATSRVEARVANPEVAYQVEDAAGVRDEFLTLAQELPITGRRGLVRSSAGAAASAAGLGAERDLQAAGHAVRASFYEVLYRESALDSLRRGAKLLESVVEILERREREGEGSGYDVLRAEQELAEIEIATAEAGVALLVARSRFGSLFEPASRMESAMLEGDLRPTDAIPEPEQAVQRALSQRADLRSLAVAAQGLDLERRASRRRRFPEPTLSAGWKRSEALGVGDTGFVAGLTVPLPIFDRAGVLVARATADRQRTELEFEILEREIRAEVLVALARERSARQVAERHGNDVERRAGELRTIAQLAYDEGETGILKLLDAHRTSLAMELRALAVRHEAKSAGIDRDLAVGDEVKP